MTEQMYVTIIRREQNWVRDRLAAIRRFMSSGQYRGLPGEDKHDLIEQEAALHQLDKVISKRLNSVH